MDRSDFKYVEDNDDSEGWKSDPFRGLRLEVPIGDITDEPRQCVEISSEWVPIIVGALERLKFGDMWDASADDMRRVEGNISTLQTLLGVGDCEGGNFDYMCNDFPLHAPNIDWLPADPFHEPGKVPLGYTLPPWVIAKNDEPLNGIRAGDVLIGAVGSLISFPPVVPLSGVPRMQMRVQGPATVDIGFARVFQGGIAVVFVDGLPNHWVDLQLYNVADLLNVLSWAEIFGFAIDTFLGAKLQDEIELEEDKEYIIEIQFFPRPAVDYSLGYGGGIRSIEICSAKEQLDVSGIVQDVRINNGTIEKFVAGLWEGVAVADGQDVLTENELRASGCKLQAYDLETGEWVDVSDANFYRTDYSCDILHEVRIVPGYDGYHLQMNSGATVNAAMVGAFGANAFLRGVGSVALITGDAMALSLNGADFGYIKDAGGGAPNNAMLNIVASGGKAPLSVQSLHASPVALQRWFNSAGSILAEVSKEGWFSASQQMIINDIVSNGETRSQGRILGQWFENTDAIRSGRIITQVDDHTGVHETFRSEASVGEARLSFFGETALPRQTITSTTLAAIVAELLESFDGFGLIDNQTGYDTETPIEEVEQVPEVYYEARWNFENSGHTQKFTVQLGDWYEGTGYVNETELGIETVKLRYSLTGGRNIVKIQVDLNVITLLSGDLYVKLEIDNGSTIDVLDEVTISATGQQTHELDCRRSGDGDFLTLLVFSEVGATAAFRLQNYREVGQGFPARDMVTLADEVVVTDIIPVGFTETQEPS